MCACMAQVLYKEQLREILPAEGHPATRGKYLDFLFYTVPTVGPYVKFGEGMGEKILLLDVIIK